MRWWLLLGLLAACGHHDRAAPPVELPVEIGASADPRLVVEAREATYTPSSLRFSAIVANRGEVTYTTVVVLVELLDGTGAVVGSTRLEPVGMEQKLGWLYPGFQASAWNSMTWSSEWKPPTRLRASVASAEIQRGEPKPPSLTDPPLRIVKPPPPNTKLGFKMVWGGDGPEGIGPSSGRVVFDVELAVTNAGTTTVTSADIAAVFEDASSKVVDRLDLDASFSPPLRPGDRRLFGGARGVLAHSTWHVDVGEIFLAR